MIRLGWSITRFSNSDAYTAVSITSGHADFRNKADADAYDGELRQAHDQDRYDVRTWMSKFSSPDDEMITLSDVARASAS